MKNLHENQIFVGHQHVRAQISTGAIPWQSKYQMMTEKSPVVTLTGPK